MLWTLPCLLSSAAKTFFKKQHNKVPPQVAKQLLQAAGLLGRFSFLLVIKINNRLFNCSLHLLSGLSFLNGWEQKRLAGPHPQKKHPEKNTKTDHTNTTNCALGQFKFNFFNSFFLPYRHLVQSHVYIFCGALRPTNSSPFFSTIRRASTKQSLARLISFCSVITLCLL